MTPQQMDSRTADRLWADYARTGDSRTRDALVLQFERLAYSVANGFARRGAEPEDLYQVARMGLVKAVDRFDPNTGYRFSTYAKPKIMGELRRYFRDHSRPVHVPRGMQELQRLVDRTGRELAGRLGQDATAAQIAEHLQVPEERVQEALSLNEGLRLVSLDGEGRSDGSEEGAGSLAETLGSEDARLANAEARVGMQQALARLPVSLREVIALRFFGGKSQREVAARLQISQMQVSRMEKKALGELRYLLGETGETGETGQPTIH